MKKKNVIIIGARGFKRRYGGWETLVQNLIYNWKDEDTQFYVWEVVHEKKDVGILNYDGVICPQLYTKKVGNATMPIFCIKAVLDAMKYVKKNKLENVIFYILGGRIGPVFMALKPILKAMNIKVICNPDGLEWKRDKWNWYEKKYWKVAEATMLKSCDHIISDSNGISSYIRSTYPKLRTPISYIAYGAYPASNNVDAQLGKDFLEKFNLDLGEYYLIVGRFIPENNYEIMINGFMKSKTNKKLLIISNIEENNFYKHLVKETGFKNDSRIIMAGPFYDKYGLEFIRKHAKGYIHGHSAGGTNPSLLEAMSTTDINLLYDVIFNREVGSDSALYFKNENQLEEVINKVENFNDSEVQKLGYSSKKRIEDFYSWDSIVLKHEKLFNQVLNEE